MVSCSKCDSFVTRATTNVLFQGALLQNRLDPCRSYLRLDCPSYPLQSLLRYSHPPRLICLSSFGSRGPSLCCFFAHLISVQRTEHCAIHQPNSSKMLWGRLVDPLSQFSTSLLFSFVGLSLMSGWPLQIHPSSHLRRRRGFFSGHSPPSFTLFCVKYRLRQNLRT